MPDSNNGRPSQRYYLNRDALAPQSKVQRPTPPKLPNSIRPKKEPAKKHLKINPLILFPIATIVLGGLVLFVVLLVLHPGHTSHANADQLPAVETQVVQGFKVYYLVRNPTDYRFTSGSDSYQSNVLVFQMHNSQRGTLAISEEAIPKGYDISALQADKQFNTEFGQAFITDGLDRTTGALFTTDKTWILINAPTPIGADNMEQILNSLSPVK